MNQKLRTILGIFLLLSLVFLACKKEFIETGPQNPMHLKTSGVYDLSGISVSYQIVCFDELSDFERLEQEVYEQDSIFAANVIIDWDSAYVLLEGDLSFSSLRMDIESDVATLEANNNLWDYNDPDDHFIYDDFLRTIFSPDAEFMIEDTIYIFVNPYRIIKIVDDWDALSNFRNGGYLEVISQSNVTITNFEYPTESELIANFSFETDGFEITFTDESDGSEDCFWDFGDGESSTSQDPTHEFSQYGTYSVTLVVSKELNDGNTLYSEITKAISLEDCNASFTYDAEDLEITLTDASQPSSDQGAYIMTWEWEWGDGSSKEYGPSPSWNQKTHTYDNAGYYTISVKITDSEECESTYSIVGLKVRSNACIENKRYKKIEKYANDT